MQIFSNKSQQVPTLDTKTIILFDGICSFCDASVQFVLDRDPKGYFYFASLQSDVGKYIISKYGLTSDLSTIILIENNQFFTKSSAVLRIAKHLTGFWSILYIFRVVPISLRDSIYEWIARNRYDWFGKKSLTCTLPTLEVRKRFLS